MISLPPHFTLGHPVINTFDLDDNVFLISLNEWLEPNASRLGGKFQKQPLQTTEYFTSMTLNVDGYIELAWHCSGQRTYSPRELFNLKNFLIISVDLLSRSNNNGMNIPGLLSVDNTPSVISVCGKELELFGATLWNGSHYISMILTDDCWVMSDGLKEYNTKGSGVWYSHTRFKEPAGYYLSYLVYCMQG